MVRASSQRSSTAPAPTTAWAWTCDEAALRPDGGAGDLAVAVDDATVRRLPYAPPTQDYARTLWQSARTLGDDDAPLVAGAGWLASEDGQTPPIFVAHSMLAAVWLLHESLPTSSRSPSDAAVFARLTQLAVGAEGGTAASPTPTSPAAAATPESPAPTSPAALPPQTTKRQRAAKAAKAATGAGAPTNVASSAEPAAKRARGKERRRALPASAPAAERDAHRSLTHGPDAPTAAWIVEQPTGLHSFGETAALPYATAQAMLAAARALGNSTARLQAMCFVRNWRQSGHPLRLAGGVSGELARLSKTQAGRSVSSSTRQQLDLAMSAITVSEAVTATAGVGYRWGMASLGQQYQDRIERLRQASPGTAVKQLQSTAKESLWRERSADSTWSWDAFNARLKRSRRWCEAAAKLGWGILLLMPTDIVTPNWAEQTLHAPQWRIWLHLVERVNPEAVNASSDFGAWLGASRPLHGSLDGTATLTFELADEPRMVEVPDSDDDNDGDDDGDQQNGDNSDNGDDDDDDKHNSDDVGSATAATLPLHRFFQPYALRQGRMSTA